jgi:hypothetical protein
MLSPRVDLKQRLKAVMQKSENQRCCDCSDVRPTWASLIVPKKVDGPIIGVLCCYQCASSHRSLGTHICRVKSCSLDECTYN